MFLSPIIYYLFYLRKKETFVSSVATQDLFRARDANTSMIKIVQTSQVKVKYHVATRDLKHIQQKYQQNPCHVVRKHLSNSNGEKGAKGEKMSVV